MTLTTEERESLTEALIDHTDGEYSSLISRAGNEYLVWAVESIVGNRLIEQRRQQAALKSEVAASSEFLTPEQLAERHQVSEGTLANKRGRGEGVPFVKIGSLVRYRISDVEAYEASRTLGTVPS